MSGHDNEELIDYEDEQDVIGNGASISASNGAAHGTNIDGEKKNFSGIHSTGFRYILSPRGSATCSDNPRVAQGLLVETRVASGHQ